MPIEIINRSAKDALARLLAGENLTVAHSSFAETASFNMETRVLTLPTWQNMSHDVIDMLIGHEVSHALYTPGGVKPYLEAMGRVADAIRTAAGIPATKHPLDDAARTGDLAKNILNVVEDVRIEKAIQARFPGLIRNFRLAYDWLVREDFFGIYGIDAQTMGLLDRLNIHFKAGKRVLLTFSAEEAVFVELIDAAKTWEDVVEASIRLGEYLAKNAVQPNSDTPPAPPPGAPGSDDGESDDDGSTAESQATTESVDGPENGDGSVPADGEDGEGEESPANRDESETVSEYRVPMPTPASDATVNRYDDIIESIVRSADAQCKTMENMEQRLRQQRSSGDKTVSGVLPAPRLDRIVVDFAEILGRL